MQELAIIEDGALRITDGRIAWVGRTDELPPQAAGTESIDASGKTVLPGFIDSHTHLIFAGSREAEFEQRLQGKTYQEIAASGGGINATVSKVRQSAREQLKTEARARLTRLLRFGVTTVEAKSGYGLSYADEIKCLEVVAELNEEGPWELIPTFLGAHAVPPEFRARRGEYLDLLIRRMLPEIAHRHLAEFCDVFCDEGAFTALETEAIFTQAQKLGFLLKLHADELTALGGAEIAAGYGATSADHLLCVT
jgi:imidazolonepropionase